MFRRIDKNGGYGKRAFTLVELIVVLVILAVIAAMLVPALTGYIRKAKKAQCIYAADEARIAAQAVMSEFYGITDGHNWPTGVNVYWDGRKVSGKSYREWGDRVLELMGRGRGKANNEPYIFVFAVGYPNDTTLSDAERYTVYYVGYVEDENSPAVFYVNGEWIYTYPTDENCQYIKKVGSGANIRNYIIDAAGDIPIQYFVVSNRATPGNDNFWISGDDSMWGHSDSNPNSRWR